MEIEKKTQGIIMLISVAGFLLAILCGYGALIYLGPEKTLGDSYRIFFFHTPSAIVSLLGFTGTLIFSVRYLIRRDVESDIYAVSTAKVSLVFVTIALIMGSIWAKFAWGEYWNWDPRETAVLILWFVYAGYFALRSAIDEFDARARSSAIFAVFGYVTVPLAYLSTRIWASLHPVIIHTTGMNLEPRMVMVFVPMIFAVLMIYISFVWIDGRLKKIEYQLMEVVE